MERTLKNAIERYELDKYIRMHGFVPREKVTELFKNATILIAPYIVTDQGGRDGIPTSMLEAMAMSVVPITTDAGAIPELIENDVNGIIVPQRNSRAIADSVERMIKDREYFMQLRERTRHKIEVEYNSEVVNRVLEDKIREFII